MKVKCSYDELVPLHKLIPHPKNRNRHPDGQIGRLAKIIDYQGMRSPIVISKLSGFITKGHGRLEALKKLGWETAPVNHQEYDNEAQEYADIIADNEIARWATLDQDGLIEDLKEIEIEDLEVLGLDDFNFDAVSIKEINQGDENSEWAGLPDFNQGDNYIKLIFHFPSEEAREAYVKKNNIEVTMKKSNQWIVHK